MARAPRRRNSERREESEARILDAAEQLFAAHGFNGVSIKDIAVAAEVDTSLVHYYFGSKAGLFTAVLARRAPGINQARIASMRDYEATARGDVTVAGAVRAYLEPAFAIAIAGGDGEHAYMSLVAQISVTPAGGLPGVDLTAFDPAIEVFIDLLQSARPDATRAELYWFYQMLSGAITQSWARTGRIDRLSGGLCDSDDMETILEQTIAIFSGGLNPIATP